MAKFSIGDKVALNSRTPSHIELTRGRPRTIVAMEYDYIGKRYFYQLGSNGRGASADGCPTDGYSAYWFRSYMLDRWNVTGKIGRPRTKRRYRSPFNQSYKSCAHQESGESERGNTLGLGGEKTPEILEIVSEN